MNKEYNPGDKITCEFTVRDRVDNNPANVFVEGRCMWVPEDSIIKHESKPWAPEIGDTIRRKDNGNLYEVKCIHEGFVWAYIPGQPTPYTYTLKEFEKVSQ